MPLKIYDNWEKKCCIFVGLTFIPLIKIKRKEFRMLVTHVTDLLSFILGPILEFVLIQKRNKMPETEAP
jgi:hypothetical protein